MRFVRKKNKNKTKNGMGMPDSYSQSLSLLNTFDMKGEMNEQLYSFVKLF